MNIYWTVIGIILTSKLFGQGGFEVEDIGQFELYKPNSELKSKGVKEVTVQTFNEYNKESFRSESLYDKKGYLISIKREDMKYLAGVESVDIENQDSIWRIKREISYEALIRGRRAPFYEFWTPYYHYWENIENLKPKVVSVICTYKFGHDSSLVTKVMLNSRLVDSFSYNPTSYYSVTDRQMLNDAISDTIRNGDTLIFRTKMTNQSKEMIIEENYYLNSRLVKFSSKVVSEEFSRAGFVKKYEYDNKGRLVTEELYGNFGKSYAARKVFEYIDSIKATLIHEDKVSQDSIFDWTTRVDSNGRIVQKLYYHAFNKIRKEYYTYYTNNLLKIKDVWFDGVQMEVSKYKYKYY